MTNFCIQEHAPKNYNKMTRKSLPQDKIDVRCIVALNSHKTRKISFQSLIPKIFYFPFSFLVGAFRIKEPEYYSHSFLEGAFVERDD